MSRVDGSIIYSDFDAPGLPTGFKSRFNSSYIEDAATQKLLEFSGSRELRMSDAPQWSIQRPPNPRSAAGKAYKNQFRKGQGIVVFSVAAAWPSKETPGCYDFLRLNYDGTTGHLIGREFITAKLILNAGAQPPLRDPQELPWKDEIDTIKLSTGKKMIRTEGQIYPVAEGSVALHSPLLNLRFSDRLLVVRFDRNQGLVEVEGRVGRPSTKLLDALLALTPLS